MREEVLRALDGHANRRGLVIAREAVLLGELRCKAVAFRSVLTELEKSGAVEILSPVPFLVARLGRSWPGGRPAGTKSAANPADSEDHSYSYSFNKQAIDKSKAIAIAGENGGPGEGEETLLQEILSTLGESDPTTFRGVLAHYPAAAIRSVLDRIRRTPSEKVRKSKTAYFRFLLKHAAK